MLAFYFISVPSEEVWWVSRSFSSLEECRASQTSTAFVASGWAGYGRTPQPSKSECYYLEEDP